VGEEAREGRRRRIEWPAFVDVRTGM